MIAGGDGLDYVVLGSTFVSGVVGDVSSLVGMGLCLFVCWWSWTFF